MKLYLALDNVRSTHNVGSVLRSGLGFDIEGVVTIGITPHAATVDDTRLPHVVRRAESQIAKTALGGETLLREHFDERSSFIDWAHKQSLDLVSLEKTASSVDIKQYQPSKRLVVVLGNEVDGVSSEILEESSTITHIAMPGDKESFNVSVAAAIAMFELTGRDL